MSDISEGSGNVNVWDGGGIVWSDDGASLKPAKVVPQYIEELVRTVAPECDVDLGDEVSVRSFIEGVLIKRITRKVGRLTRLEHLMSPYFDKEDIEAVRCEIGQCVEHLPREVQSRVVQVARSDIKFSVLNKAVKDGVLIEADDRDLFKTIIRHHAQNMK